MERSPPGTGPSKPSEADANTTTTQLGPVAGNLYINGK
jgi:hypothetical protein